MASQQLNNLIQRINGSYADEYIGKVLQNPSVVVAFFILMTSILVYRLNSRNRKEDIRKTEKALIAELRLLNTWWDIWSKRTQIILREAVSQNKSLLHLEIGHIDGILDILERYHNQISIGYQYLSGDRADKVRLVQSQIRTTMRTINNFLYGFELSKQYEKYTLESSVRTVSIQLVKTSYCLSEGYNIVNKDSSYRNLDNVKWRDIIKFAETELDKKLFDTAKIEMDIFSSDNKRVYI